MLLVVMVVVVLLVLLVVLVVLDVLVVPVGLGNLFPCLCMMHLSPSLHHGSIVALIYTSLYLCISLSIYLAIHLSIHLPMSVSRMGVVTSTLFIYRSIYQFRYISLPASIMEIFWE